MKNFLITPILLIVICHLNLFSKAIKLHNLKNPSVKSIEKGEGNTYYSISNLRQNCYIGYSENGFENLELKYFDSLIIIGATIQNKPNIPYAIKYFNNNVYISYDNSMIVKFDKKLNPLDTLYLKEKFQIIDKMFIINNKIVISNYSEGAGVGFRELQYFDNNEFIKINEPSNNIISIYTPININYTNNLILINISLNKVDDSTIIAHNIYSTQNYGENWDSIQLKNPSIRLLTEYRKNQYFCFGTRLKFPEKSQNEQYIKTILFKNKDYEKVIDLDSNIFYGVVGDIAANNKYQFSYSTEGLVIINDIDFSLNIIKFNNYLNEMPNLLRIEHFEISENKYLITGEYNQVIELDLDILSSIETNPNDNFLIFPNPSSDKISVDLGEIGGVGFADLSIYDILGNEIMIIPNYTNKAEIDVNNIPIGTYTIQIQTPTGSISKRLLVNR